MNDISPADGFLDDGDVAIGIGETAGLNNGLENGETELLQRKIRLRTVRVRIRPRQDADILSNGLQGFDRTPAGSRDAIPRDIKIVDDK